jgi:hypothetical protein
MLKRYIFVLLLGVTVATQFGCAVGAGLAGAAIGHEAAEHKDRHDKDRD